MYELLDNFPHHEVPDEEKDKSPMSIDDERFDTCMHDSLHFVLGLCAQTQDPSYKEIACANNGSCDMRSDVQEFVNPPRGSNSQTSNLVFGKTSDSAKTARNEIEVVDLDGSVSDETLMQMSSMYDNITSDNVWNENIQCKIIFTEKLLQN